MSPKYPHRQRPNPQRRPLIPRAVVTTRAEGPVGSLPALATSGAASRVPRLDDEVVCGVSEANDNTPRDVGAEEVRGASRRITADDGGLTLGVGHLLDAAGDLRVPPPFRRVRRPAVQRKAWVALEVEGLQRPPHAPEPQLTVGEVHLGAADARGAVAPERGEGLVDVSVKETASQCGELGNLGFDFSPARHGRSTTSPRRAPR